MVTSQEIRRQAILETLQETPLTIEELAERTGNKYHTVYKSVRELQEDGLVHQTGQVKDKKIVWAAGSSSGMPEFYDPATGKRIRADHIVYAFASQRDAASIRAAKAFFETLEQLINLAQELSEGKTNATQRDLDKLRHQVIVNRSYVKNLGGFYEQLLENSAFWKMDTLGAVGLAVEKIDASASSSENS